MDLITSINAKKVEHNVYLQVIDSRDNIEMLVTKWKHISKAIMANVHYDYDKPVCKDKWGSFL